MWEAQLASQKIAALAPYEPGKPIDEVKRELGLSHIVKLASNENPLGASPTALDAVGKAISACNLYPDASGYILKKAISEKFKVELNQITLGNGSNDVLELLMRVFVNETDEVLFSQYAFAVYQLVTQAIGATGIQAPALNFGHDLNAILNCIHKKTKMIIIANPNNPTGTWLSYRALIEFIKKVPAHILIVIDEAYVEFPSDSQYGSLINNVIDFSNVIVTRTFSKAYGLAGLRIGFMVANPEVTNLVNRVRQPFNVNSLGLLAASLAIHDEAHLQIGVKMVRDGLLKMQAELGTRKIHSIPSAGNFIAIETQKPCRDVFKALLKEGVITRALDNYGMPNHLRVTIGLPEENAFFLNAFDKVTVL